MSLLIEGTAISTWLLWWMVVLLGYEAAADVSSGCRRNQTPKHNKILNINFHHRFHWTFESGFSPRRDFTDCLQWFCMLNLYKLYIIMILSYLTPHKYRTCTQKSFIFDNMTGICRRWQRRPMATTNFSPMTFEWTPADPMTSQKRCSSAFSPIKISVYTLRRKMAVY